MGSINRLYLIRFYQSHFISSISLNFDDDIKMFGDRLIIDGVILEL